MPEEDHGSGSKLSSGALFPVVVNFLVLVALAGGFWFLVRPNWSTEAMAHSAGVSYETTEGFIVERVRAQAEQEISAQEQRIAEVRRQLEELRERQLASPVPNEEAGAQATELQNELDRLITNLDVQRSQLQQQQDDVTSRYEVRLGELVQRQEEQRFVLNQLKYSYQTVDRHLSAGNSVAATEELNRADQFIRTYSAAGEGGFADTLAVLGQGNGALMEALQLLQQVSERGTDEVDSRVVEQLERLETAANLVAEGDSVFAAGNVVEAEELYRNALSALEPTERAFQQVSSLEAERNEAAGLDAAAMRAEQLRLERALSSSRQEVRRLESRIEERDGAIAALQSEVQETLASARSALAREISSSPTTDPERLADLIETKTLIREVLISDVVQRQYPELYEEMELYIDTLGESRVAEGRTQGLYDAVVALQELMEGIGIAPATRVSSIIDTYELRAVLAEELLVLVQGVLAQAQ